MAKDKTIATPTSLEEALPIIESLKADNEGLQKKIVELETEVEASGVAIAELSAKLDETPSVSAPLTFELEGVTYKVIYPQFNYKEKNWTAEEVLEDANIQAELVGIGFGGFEIVE